MRVRHLMIALAAIATMVVTTMAVLELKRRDVAEAVHDDGP